MSDLLIQIKTFFLTLALGIVTGFIFHYYQLTIAKARVGKYPLYILDFFLWIIMIGLVFSCMLWINQGEMRVYVLIALVMGMLIYYYYFSKRMHYVVELASRLTVGIISLIIRIIKRPFLWLKGSFKSYIAKKQAPPPEDDD